MPRARKQEENERKAEEEMAKAWEEEARLASEFRAEGTQWMMTKQRPFQLAMRELRCRLSERRKSRHAQQRL